MSRKLKNLQNKKNDRDIRYNSEIIEMLVKKLMWDGKKSVAYKICYDALDRASKKLNCTPIEAFDKAIEKVKPILEVKSRRVGGATYQVPVEVTWKRSTVLAIRWLVDFSRAKKGKSMSVKLSDELIAAAKGEGVAVKKREDTHKMAEANKAFAHYRW
ncbi:MAG: 30S ribosomal protein S7 [Elusimicrobiota bacterium]